MAMLPDTQSRAPKVAAKPIVPTKAPTKAPVKNPVPTKAPTKNPVPMKAPTTGMGDLRRLEGVQSGANPIPLGPRPGVANDQAWRGNTIDWSKTRVPGQMQPTQRGVPVLNSILDSARTANTQMNQDLSKYGGGIGTNMRNSLIEMSKQGQISPFENGSGIGISPEMARQLWAMMNEGG